MRVGKLKARLRTSLAVPASKAWGVSRASLGPDSIFDRAAGVDRLELKPLEKAKVFTKGGSPPSLEGGGGHHQEEGSQGGNRRRKRRLMFMAVRLSKRRVRG